MNLPIKNFLLKYLPSIFYFKRSYSQEGEDLVVNKYLIGLRNGFYLEVGAHHPFRFSNTYFFYKRGWKGICIDPLPGTKKLFKRWRPRDMTLEVGISSSSGPLNYFMFTEPAINTFDPILANSRSLDGYSKIRDIVEIQTTTLSQLLIDQELEGRNIDLLAIDAEGFDFEVLGSYDWSKPYPSVIIIEVWGLLLSDFKEDPTFLFLASKGYILYAKTGQSLIFTRALPT
jgi:FkbM family methyltransferase